MATTENTITGSTSAGPHSFTFPYIKADDVKVSKNGGLPYTKVTDFSSDVSVRATEYKQATTSITLGAALVSADKLRIYRVTSDTDLTATFYPGSAIRSADLNDNFTQNLYSTQEVVSRYLDAGGNISLRGDFDGGGYQLTNVGKITSTELDISGDIDIDGTTNLDTVDIDGKVTITTAGELDVIGQTHLDNVDIDGSVDMKVGLTVNGTTNLDTVDIDGAVDMATTLHIHGNIDADGDIDVSGTSNLDTVDIDETLHVQQTSTFVGAITAVTGISGDLIVNGNVAAGGFTGAGVVTNGQSTSNTKVYSCDEANTRFFSSDYSTEVNTVYNNIGAVQAVGRDLANSFNNIDDYGAITAAVTSSSGTSDIQTVADSIANVDLVGPSITNVNKVSEDLNLSYTRQLSPQTGGAIVYSAISSSSPYFKENDSNNKTTGYSDADAQIYNYLWDNKAYFDFDGDGIVSPTDGMIFYRLLVGAAFSGDAVKANLYMSANATRTDGDDIWAWFNDHKDNTTIDRGTYSPPNGDPDEVIGTKGVYDIDASGGTLAALGAGLLMVRVFGTYDDEDADPKDISSTSTFLTPHDSGPAVWNSGTSTWDWPGTSKITTVYNDIKVGGSNNTNTVADAITNVNAVGTDITNVNTVATDLDLGASSKITKVYDDLKSSGNGYIEDVATNISNVNTVAGDTTAINNITTNLTHVQNAATNATTATTKASEASTSATNAAASATTATTQASTATTQATAATTAKTGAETAKTGAETAQTAAELAETNAETAETNTERIKAEAVTARDLAEDYKDLAQGAYSDTQGLITQQGSLPYNISSASDWGLITQGGGYFANETSNTLLTMSAGSSTYDYLGV